MNLVYTIINLIVLFLLLRHFLIKPVSDIMEKRRQMIADGLQGAQDAQSDAQKMKQEYEDALKGAKPEIFWKLQKRMYVLSVRRQ